MPNLNPGSKFQEVWIAALTRYKQDTKCDYLDHGLEADSPDALCRVLDKELGKFKQYRKKGEKVHNAIKPVLELVNMPLETIGESLATVSIASCLDFQDRFNFGGTRYFH